MSDRITKTQGQKLIKLARASIGSYFSEKEIDMAEYKEFSEKRGVFVTLTMDGELRGCIGFPEPVYPLNKAVFMAAQSAAFEDPRFFQLVKEELPSIRIEISVLTVPEEIKVKTAEEYLKKIDIGEDGLIIRGALGSGLLLPQVFVEYKSTPLKALEMVCEKAGLGKDDWKNMKNRIYKFQAQIFEEEK